MRKYLPLDGNTQLKITSTQYLVISEAVVN